MQLDEQDPWGAEYENYKLEQYIMSIVAYAILKLQILIHISEHQNIVFFLWFVCCDMVLTAFQTIVSYLNTLHYLALPCKIMISNLLVIGYVKLCFCSFSTSYPTDSIINFIISQN